MKKNSISYCIPACNEIKELTLLLNQLLTAIDGDDEVIIQLDSDSVIPEMEELVEQYREEFDAAGLRYNIIRFPLNKNFAAFKNNLKDHSTRPYIFQIDADELLHIGLLHHIKDVLGQYPDVDGFHIPRINVVRNVTLDYVRSQGWKIEKSNFEVTQGEPIINFPDPQLRLFKNDSEVKWERPVHEVVTGLKNIAKLYGSAVPEDEVEAWCIIHFKEFERQKVQNNFYSTL